MREVRRREREKVPGKIFFAGVNFYSLSSFGTSFSCLIRILFKANGVSFRLATRGMFKKKRHRKERKHVRKKNRKQLGPTVSTELETSSTRGYLQTYHRLP